MGRESTKHSSDFFCQPASFYFLLFLSFSSTEEKKQAPKTISYTFIKFKFKFQTHTNTFLEVLKLKLRHSAWMNEIHPIHP